MRNEFLTFSPPMIGDEEIDEVVATLRSKWLTTGPRASAFEREFSEYVEAPAAVAVNSCTAALHLSLKALGIGSGDEVITTPVTFAASVNVIEHVGARPVLVDVQPDTLNIDPERVEGAVTSRTRAILPVHYGGHPVDLDPLVATAERHGLAVVEDAAHAVGARYRGRPIGTGDNPVAFSFYATKNLTTGEGGMLTASPDLVERARSLALHGMSRGAWGRYEKGGKWQYEVTEPGFKYNMPDLLAAIGLWQLRKLDAFQERRRQIARSYREAFSGQEALELPAEREDVEHAWHLFVLRLRPETLTIGRDRFIEELAERNIGSSVHFIPIHLHPFYRDRYGFDPGDFPVALDSFERMLSIPLSPALTDRDVGDVIDAVLDVVGSHRR